MKEIKLTNNIHCPFCGEEPCVDFIVTGGEGYQLECEECNRSFAYVITQFDWETYDEYDEFQCGNSELVSPPTGEYNIPSYLCRIEHWTILKNWKRFTFMDWVDWFALLFPISIRKSFFTVTKNELF